MARAREGTYIDVIIIIRLPAVDIEKIIGVRYGGGPYKARTTHT